MGPLWFCLAAKVPLFMHLIISMERLACYKFLNYYHYINNYYTIIILSIDFKLFSCMQVYDCSKADLQLVGVSAMLLASKYEEMYAPEIGDFVYITDNTYSKAEIRKMEAKIFKTLNFSVGKPLCLHFLRRNSKAGEVWC